MPVGGVTSFGAASSTVSVSVTRPSSLLRAHAPDHVPPAGFGFLLRQVFASCHEPLLENGLSRRYLCNPCIGARTPAPQRPFGAYPFLPEGHRPHLRWNRFSTLSTRRHATSTTYFFSRLQSFANVRAPILARPSGCTYRCGYTSAGQPGRLHHAGLMPLPYMSSGIATCLKRAIGTTGLSPAGLQPCRLLSSTRRIPFEELQLRSVGDQPAKSLVWRRYLKRPNTADAGKRLSRWKASHLAHAYISLGTAACGHMQYMRSRRHKAIPVMKAANSGNGFQFRRPSRKCGLVIRNRSVTIQTAILPLNQETHNSW